MPDTHDNFETFRQLEGTGISGLLDESCKVIYANVFSQRHLGRISDLLAGKIRSLDSTKPDELKLRAVLLFAAFEAWRARMPTDGAAEDSPLSEPLTLECGYDKTRVAVGVSFSLRERIAETDGLAERLEKGNPVSEFDAFLFDLKAKSHCLTVRIHPDTNQIEVISLLDRQATEAPGAKIIVVTVQGKPETASSGEYIELGDLDYGAILKEDGPAAKQVEPSPMGELLAKSFDEVEEERRIEAEAREKETTTQVDGGEEEDEHETSIGGEKPEKDEFSQTVAGEKHSKDEFSVTFAAEAKVKEEDHEVRFKAEPKDELTELEDGLAGLKKDKPAAKSGGMFKKLFSWGASAPEEEEAIDESGAELTGALKAKAKAKKAVSTADVPEAESDELAEAITADVSGPDAPMREAGTPPPVASDVATGALLKELQTEMGGIDKTLNQAQADANQIKTETGSDRARRWVDGLMGELLTEKSRLHELAKKLNQSVRQKEMEFRNKERALLTDIKARDEHIKQKQHQLSRVKDQLTQANMTIERLKGSGIAGSDDAHYKQKYAHVQKMLVSTKDESVLLKAQVEDLKAEINTLKQSPKKSGPSPEVGILKEKLDRLAKQNEEFKRVNQGLTEKLAEKKKDAPLKMVTQPSGNSDELKKKLDVANKQVVGAQKEAELYKLKFEEMQEEQKRLKGEIIRLQRQVVNPGSSGGASMTKAPGAKGPAKPGAGSSGAGGSKPPKAA